MTSRPKTTGAMVAAIAAATGAGAPAAGQTEYEIVDLTTLAEPSGVAQSEARGVNDGGQIVGFEVVADFIERAIFWDADGTVDVLDRLPGDNSNIAIGIENDGSILGLSELVEIIDCGNFIKVFETQKATVWQGETLIDLNDLVVGGDTSFTLRFAQDRNDAGRIVGFGRDPKGPPFTPRGFLLDEGIVTELGALDRPIAINELDQVVGYNTTDGQDNAYLWDGGKLLNLHEDPSIGGVTSRAFGINDAGLIVGEAQFEISDPEEPAAWIRATPFKLVPDVVQPQGVATAVNGAGQVVGFFNDLDDLATDFRGFLWQDGVRTELLELIPPELGWEILFPFDINEQGVIVGGGVRNGQLGRAFVMTPAASCPWDLDGSGSVGTPDFLDLLAQWGTDPGGPPDFDGDGTVGTPDFLELLANWGRCL